MFTDRCGVRSEEVRCIKGIPGSQFDDDPEVTQVTGIVDTWVTLGGVICCCVLIENKNTLLPCSN